MTRTSNRGAATLRIAVVTGLACFCFHPATAQDEWPGIPRLEAAYPEASLTPLPASITATPIERDRWNCDFRFHPQGSVQRAALVGSFNGWDREANAMTGPDASGQWTTSLTLSTGVYEYKFLVNNEDWYADPANLEQVPDGFGNYNSVARIGRLAEMRKSDARTGDGRIDVGGLEHQLHLSLYTQPVDAGRVSIRYRTLTGDVERVSVSIKDRDTLPMQVACIGPLFTYWETTVPMTVTTRTRDLPSIVYTFVLEDGGQRVCDPYTYHYTHLPVTAAAAPAWARDAIWYEVMLDRFRNGDPSNDPQPVRPWTSAWFTPSEWEGKDGQTFYQNFVFERNYGGDLAGLEAMLPYLKELGVNTLYLTPIFKAPSYHKYDVQDYRHVDDHFGACGDYDGVAVHEDLLDPATWQWTQTDRQFLALVDKAHTMGFKVILDAVFNHVGVDHPAFVDVLRHSKRSRFADWFEVTSWEPFAYKGWAGFAHMPVFRKNRSGYASPTLKAHLFAVTRRWMDPNGDGDPSDGIDGWRLDVPNDIPPPFWAEWRSMVKELNPDALITGEVWTRADRWLDGKHFDAVMNYEFARTAVAWIFDRENKLPASLADARLAELRLAYPQSATYLVQNLVNSHDTDRLASMAANPDREYDRQNRVQDNNPEYDNTKPDDQAYARARLALLLQCTYIGAPLIYYGDEAGMWGADDPSNRKPMLWKDLEPYDDPDENRVMEDHLAFYRAAIRLRADHPALRSGTFRTVLTDDATDVWAFLRQVDDETLLVALNASATAQTIDVPIPAGTPTTWRIVFGGQGDVNAADGSLPLALPALGGVVLRAAP